MRLKIIGKSYSKGDFVCIDEEGKRHCGIDLFVDNREWYSGEDKDLIGKTIEVDYLQPHIEIAVGVKLINEEIKDAGREG